MRVIWPGRRGSILVMALFIVLLLTAVGLYLIGSVRGTYAASRGSASAVQARYIALAGMEEAMVKLAKDPNFPQGVPDDHESFSYQESIGTRAGGSQLGLYTVTVDWSDRENGFLSLLCVGTVGTVRQSKARFLISCRIREADFEVLDWQEGLR